ncbi:MAG: CTP synthase [Endomicrobia bacterium]|nr:CTP synthase [Endomicrobiia bacterium]
MAKYIFVTGGVVSSLGKGITGASVGKLLQLSGFRVNMIKFDPYINVDPGTMNPYQHGEVYVTVDGAEADLDLGTYERFLDINATKANTNTAGDIYLSVIRNERRGDYNGATVQVIPHITDEIKRRFALSKNDYDIIIIEIGGTAGDIEGLPFMEAARQFKLENPKDVLSLHVTLVPYIAGAHELKTKPTQHSVIKMREIGLSPDIIVCRTERELDKNIKEKISLFCNVKPGCIIEARDSASIYHVPESLYKQKADKIILENLKLKPKKRFDKTWFNKIKRLEKYDKEVKIAVVGKYAGLKDAYKSIDESLKIAAADLKAKACVDYLNAEDPMTLKKLKNYNGVLVPGGFGIRGVEGKIATIKYCRQHKIPFLGICLGMQCVVIEAARNMVGLKDAHSAEFNKTTPHPVVKILDQQKNVTYRGGTMRLGNYTAVVEKGSLAYKLYKTAFITERHRHRYEMNPSYIWEFEKAGVKVSAYHKGILPEITEIPSHPFFIAVQFHPEFASRPGNPHPLFKGLIGAALRSEKRNNK